MLDLRFGRDPRVKKKYVEGERSPRDGNLMGLYVCVWNPKRKTSVLRRNRSRSLEVDKDTTGELFLRTPALTGLFIGLGIGIQSCGSREYRSSSHD